MSRAARQAGDAAEPLVGIVTPVYNGEPFLVECIESVLRQTHRRWEWVLVDNRSTDGSAEIIRGYAAREPRIRLETPPDHVDAVRNFNRAFRALPAGAAYGKAVCADDWLYPECLERMVAVAEAHPSVGIVGAYRLDGTRVNLDGLPPGREVFPGREVCAQCLRGGPYVTGSPTSTMIRADILRARDPFYDETIRASDTHVAYSLLCDGDFGFVHQVLTYTRRHPGAQTSFATRVQTYMPENLRALVHYGPRVFSPQEYRRRLRRDLASYLAYLARQAVQLRPALDPEYREFHLRNLGYLQTDLAGWAPARPWLAACRALLGAGGRPAPDELQAPPAAG